MMRIEHGCDTIKSIPICVVLLEPKPYVTEQKALNFIFTVIKDSAVPQRMITLSITMEVLIVSTIPHINTFIYILSSMRMNNINNDLNVMFMRLVHKLLELMRLTKSRADTKKVSHMITKRPVIRMLHYTHNLNYVISQLDYFREDDFSEMVEAVDFVFDAAHSDVAFVNLDVVVFP